MEPKVDSNTNSVTVMLDEDVFPRSVGLAAAYHFLERCYVRLERRPPRRLEVRLRGKVPLDRSALQELGGELGNELVHQLMRQQVSERTDQLRAVLVGRAMLSAEPELVGECAPTAEPAAAGESWGSLDYLDDPLGIAVPWEESHADETAPAPAKGEGKAVAKARPRAGAKARRS